MPPLPKTYRFLAGVDDGAVDDALAAGVRELDGPYLRFAVDVLLQRARPDGLPAVIECYHRLPPELQSRVLAAEDAIVPLLRTTVWAEKLQTRLNSLKIASRIGSESLAYLLDMGLMDTQPKVRDLAALTIRQMARRLLAEHPLLRSVTPTGAATASTASAAKLTLRRHHLFEALLLGANRYESHLRPEVVEACMWFEPYLGQRFWGLLAQPRSKLPRLVAELLIGSDEPATALLLMQATAVADLRSQAVKMISERRDGQWFRAALRGVEIWHPWQRVRRGWHFIKDITFLYTLDEAGWADLGDRAALPILIAASNQGVQRKTLLMERLWRQASGAACRRQILLEAHQSRDWGTPILAAALRESNDPTELRMAAYGLLGIAHEGLLGGLVKRIGRMGEAAPAGLVDLTADLVFWRLWTRFDAMQEQHRVAALAGIRGVADYLKDRLRVSLASSSTSYRLRAVRVAGLLGLVDTLWKDMRLAARDVSPRVRSAAVRFLGQSRRPELRQSLLAALEDSDARVQANALDAMDEAGWPDLANLIVSKLQSEHCRVRANAARSLARTGHEAAIRVLTEMLEDGRTERRLAAIRAIQQVGEGPWQEKLVDLAENDPSIAVRRQAAACVKSAARRQALIEKKRRQGQEEQRQEPADRDSGGNRTLADSAGAAPNDPADEEVPCKLSVKPTAKARVANGAAIAGPKRTQP